MSYTDLKLKGLVFPGKFFLFSSLKAAVVLIIIFHKELCHKVVFAVTSHIFKGISKNFIFCSMEIKNCSRFLVKYFKSNFYTHLYYQTSSALS